MESITDNYRSYLTQELERRCRRNPIYSQRAFAKDLGLSSAGLSHVMNGRYGLSKASATKIARKLSLDPIQKEYFCTLVEAAHSRNKKQREAAAKKLLDFKASYKYLSLDSFKIIADWYHLAILELANTKSFDPAPGIIAKRLKISLSDVTTALERLERLGMIIWKDGKIQTTGYFHTNPEGVPSEAVRKFHSQMLSNAQESLQSTPVQEREFASLTLSFDPHDLPEAKKMIQEFQDQFENKFSHAKNKTEVYGLNVQFFGLSQKQSK